MYACPKHVRTDHPVLVYKTCEIERTVLRLFSCLPPTIEPSPAQLYLALLALYIAHLCLLASYLHLKYIVVASLLQ